MPFKKYDLIITNPPYVNARVDGASCRRNTGTSRRSRWPAARDGMDLVRQIVAGAAERLTDDGLLIVEIGNEREHAEAAFGDLGLTWLSTSAGDDMVFLLTAEQLQQARL